MIHSLTGILAAGLAVSAGVLWAAWLLVCRSRERSVLRRSLHDPDPMTRLAAIRLVERAGIAPYIDSLRWRIRTEDDAEVRAALAATVSADSWQKSWADGTMELRIWAHRHHAAEPTAPPATGGETVDHPS